MKTNKSLGFVSVVIISIIAVLVISGGVFYYKQKKETERIKKQVEELGQTQPINNEKSNQSLNEQQDQLLQQVQQVVDESKEINKDPSSSLIKTSYTILVKAGKENNRETVQKYIIDKDLQTLISNDEKFSALMEFLSNLTDPTDLMNKKNIGGLDNIIMVTHLLVNGTVGATCGLPFAQENGVWKLHFSYLFCN